MYYYYYSPHQLAPTQPHQSAFVCRPTLMYAQTKNPPFYCFFIPPNIFTPPNFFHEASFFHLSLEWMRRRLSTVGGNAGNERKTPKQVTQHCVFAPNILDRFYLVIYLFALCRKMTVHYKGIKVTTNVWNCCLVISIHIALQLCCLNLLFPLLIR